MSQELPVTLGFCPQKRTCLLENCARTSLSCFVVERSCPFAVWINYIVNIVKEDLDSTLLCCYCKRICEIHSFHYKAWCVFEFVEENHNSEEQNLAATFNAPH